MDETAISNNGGSSRINNMFITREQEKSKGRYEAGSVALKVSNDTFVVLGK